MKVHSLGLYISHIHTTRPVIFYWGMLKKFLGKFRCVNQINGQEFIGKTKKKNVFPLERLKSSIEKQFSKLCWCCNFKTDISDVTAIKN